MMFKASKCSFYGGVLCFSANDGVKMLDKEHPDWVRVIKGCYKIAAEYGKSA
jgi:hypothetical protein